ncbi:class F sortase [Candidatus Kaiserbacteria bacterium]|nr:class F sortase [Candidatus Kaiserbacteria bacterium]
MRNRIIGWGLLSTGVILFGATLVHATAYAPERQQPPPQYSAAAVAVPAARVPSRLRIPALGIDAAVQAVGQNSAGNMAAPSNYTDVGWYKYGPAPGATGSAVIDGHLDNGLALPGVFKHLDAIQKGDVIEVTDVDGVVRRFVVDRVASYEPATAPTKEIFAKTGPPRLVLITCAGEWVPTKKTYDTRLIVYANLASTL